MQHSAIKQSLKPNSHTNLNNAKLTQHKNKNTMMQAEIPYLHDDVIHIVSNKRRLQIRLLIHMEVHVLHPVHVATISKKIGNK